MPFGYNPYVIKVTEEMGRGLYCNHTSGLNSGDVIAQCEILVLSEKDTAILYMTDLKYYTFHFNEKQDCLVLGDGEIFNHSDSPNVSYQLVQFEGRQVMQFKVARFVGPGEQLFIDYNADTKVYVEDYKNNKSLMK